MNIAKTDIDIDTGNRDKLLELMKHIPASIKDKNGLKKHNTGVYCTDIPVNPMLGISNIEYKEAEERGYFKLDILNVSIYNDVKDEKHLVELLNQEPLWDLLTHKEFSSQLFHVGEHSSILQTMKPTSIEQLAMVLAIIRPAKRHLLGKSWTEVENQVWIKPTDGSYYFKKAHAIAYAHAIVVQMNLICNDFSGVLTPQSST
tara:strand:+ start:4790 stop:5395 length:606 start_codon:yes stop_codon:yes gene_type:complete